LTENNQKIFQSHASSPIHIEAEEISKENPDEGRLALDIFETEETLFIVAPLAGVDPEEIDISISEDVLIIRGDRRFPENLPTSSSKFFTEECFWGPFSRSIVLPSAVNSADIQAKMKKNILIISIPKVKKAKSKKIPIDILS
jgi:HSP20 family protein